ncbi:hypothetical protein PR048_017000 [Dryococelus australis]|uniref:Uncharacterized protein n=1 Tax=Dryococelus australis TaxID=614101 RepID=A0ABQ9H8A2_9NEOP|nr:hypothetical protein PR048_017000 [Dryococelus australis]
MVNVANEMGFLAVLPLLAPLYCFNCISLHVLPLPIFHHPAFLLPCCQASFVSTHHFNTFKKADCPVGTRPTDGNIQHVIPYVRKVRLTPLAGNRARRSSGSNISVWDGERGRGTEVFPLYRRAFKRMLRRECSVSEADPLTGWWRGELWREDSRYAAMVARGVARHQDVMVRQFGVQLELLSNDNAFLGFYPRVFSQRTLTARARNPFINWGRGGRAAGLPASHRGESGSTPGRVTPGSSQVGIVPDDAASRRVFSGIYRPPPPALAFQRRSILTLFHPHRLSRPRSRVRGYINVCRFQMNDSSTPHTQFFLKPVYMVMALMSLLEDTQLSVTISPPDDRQVTHFLSISTCSA